MCRSATPSTSPYSHLPFPHHRIVPGAIRQSEHPPPIPGALRGRKSSHPPFILHASDCSRAARTKRLYTRGGRRCKVQQSLVGHGGHQMRECFHGNLEDPPGPDQLLSRSPSLDEIAPLYQSLRILLTSIDIFVSILAHGINLFLS